jgi:hypothetical protein
MAALFPGETRGWHPVTPYIDDPDLAPRGMPAFGAGGAPGYPPAPRGDGRGGPRRGGEPPADAPEPPSKAGGKGGFFGQHRFALLVAAVVLLIIAVVVYVYMTRRGGDPQAKPKKGAAKEGGTPPAPAGVDLEELSRLRAARRQARNAGPAGPAPAGAAAAKPERGEWAARPGVAGRGGPAGRAPAANRPDPASPMQPAQPALPALPAPRAQAPPLPARPSKGPEGLGLGDGGGLAALEAESGWGGGQEAGWPPPFPAAIAVTVIEGGFGAPALQSGGPGLRQSPLPRVEEVDDDGDEASPAGGSAPAPFGEKGGDDDLLDTALGYGTRAPQ